MLRIDEYQALQNTLRNKIVYLSIQTNIIKS